MPKQRLITTNPGGYTAIRATTAVHYLKVYKDGDRDTALMYKEKSDGFIAEYTTAVTDAVEQIGHGRSGLIGRPPNYNAEDTPLLVAPAADDSGGGDVILYVKMSDDSAKDIVIYESENEL